MAHPSVTLSSLWSGRRVKHAWGRGTLPSMRIRGERRAGEVLVTVDGAPLDWRSSLSVARKLGWGRCRPIVPPEDRAVRPIGKRWATWRREEHAAVAGANAIIALRCCLPQRPLRGFLGATSRKTPPCASRAKLSRTATNFGPEPEREMRGAYEKVDPADACWFRRHQPMRSGQTGALMFTLRIRVGDSVVSVGAGTPSCKCAVGGRGTAQSARRDGFNGATADTTSDLARSSAVKQKAVCL